MRNKKNAFTLVEVLITLSIIGVVAAITLPLLLTTVNTKIKEHQQEVISKRLVQGLNMFNTLENGLSQDYSSTYEFLEGLSKHYKMSSICDKDHLGDCFPYEKIRVIADDVTDVKISSLKSVKKLSLPENFLSPAAFISSAGVPYLVAWDKNCSSRYSEDGTTVIDPDRTLKEVPPCLAGFYDINGANSPNKISQSEVNDDIISFNGAKLTPCLVKGTTGLCVVSAYKNAGNYLTGAECEKYFSETSCSSNARARYAAYAIRQCENDGGHLTSMEEIATKIVPEMYVNAPSELGPKDTFSNNSRGIVVPDLDFNYSSPVYQKLKTYTWILSSTDEGENCRFFNKTISDTPNCNGGGTGFVCIDD